MNRKRKLFSNIITIFLTSSLSFGLIIFLSFSFTPLFHQIGSHYLPGLILLVFIFLLTFLFSFLIYRNTIKKIVDHYIPINQQQGEQSDVSSQ